MSIAEGFPSSHWSQAAGSFCFFSQPLTPWPWGKQFPAGGDLCQGQAPANRVHAAATSPCSLSPFHPLAAAWPQLEAVQPQCNSPPARNCTYATTGGGRSGSSAEAAWPWHSSPCVGSCAWTLTRALWGDAERSSGSVEAAPSFSALAQMQGKPLLLAHPRSHPAHVGLGLRGWGEVAEVQAQLEAFPVLVQLLPVWPQYRCMVTDTGQSPPTQQATSSNFLGWIRPHVINPCAMVYFRIYGS